MTQWGRRADPIEPRRTAGRTSVVLAVIATVTALVVVGLWKFALPTDASADIQGFAALGAINLILGLTGLIHLAGIVCGVVALIRKDDNRLLGFIGLALNGTFPGAAIGATYFLMRTGVAS